MLEKKLAKIEDSLLSFIEGEKLDIFLQRDKFPISATITNVEFDKDQISMIESDKKLYNGFIEFVFEDELIMKIKDFKIEDELLNKIKTRLKKWHYTYLEFFFENYMVHRNLIGDDKDD